MYTDFFSLTEKPFSITPDPAFLFLSKRHEEALAHLLYGVTDSGGFIQLTGEVGTGKTTIIRSLFEKLPDNVEIALILNPRLSVNEFLHSICDELKLPLSPDASNKDCFDALNPYLLKAYAKGDRVVLLVDEAQNLSVEVLEQIRLLTNLETHKHKLLQIILVGQPELQTLLQRQDLRQLAQRITARYSLKPLGKDETRAYIKHRLNVAGAKYNIFKPAAEYLIHKAANGIPRIINVISDRALLGAFSLQVPMVDAAIAKTSIKEVLGDASVAINKERATPRSKSGVSRWLWVPVLGAMAFAAWQLPQTQDFLNKVGVTQAQTQSNDSRTLSNANDKTAANSEPDSNGSDTNQTAAPTDNQSQLAIKTLTDADAVITPAKDLSSLLLEHAQDTSAEKSFNQLLVTWGRSKFYEHANACNNLKILGLRCLYQKGQWEHVVKLNRPVILELSDAQAAPHHLLVTQADADTATVRIEENTYTVPISEIISAWNGSYLVFWQPERPEAVSLFWGSNSEAVIWLREQLDGLGLVAAGADRTRLFDADLVEAVKKFQSSQGILADGIVGSETFLVLNNAIGVSGRPNLNMDVK